jgi:hypothetical protein
MRPDGTGMLRPWDVALTDSWAVSPPVNVSVTKIVSVAGAMDN